ncbi:putative membrane associated protein [Roseomonas mucosa]|uniref:Predicted secreted protein n=1 Tax=Roseomonas mucosa TaxID=207340 RepID=A0A379N6T3_9PROT|nr:MULTISPECIES: DUF1467 family protein [Roseomonas]MBS5901719.1 DUF1467 family protein [Acetobacteraceae bacterium]AWV23484.1 putative membrane associated protein [Roseomonas mucosa]MCG7352134.1 DUF1467 family protein [Roseomonas mucosa]MCG7357516.1 DUF1467 family protein [Roseomonas mucosa]MDT8277034.1 DUF1467 family protein [Roseomonas mucosa]
MGVVTGIVVFFLVWWTVLFVTLPLGVRPDTDAESTPGGWRGAPLAPRLGRKVLLTTAISAVVWVGLEMVIRSDYLSFRHGWLAMH